MDQALWPGKLIVKGILDVEDAKTATKIGADAIVVSNHGGRQLDGAPSSISMLPKIADAVGNDIEVMFDGGIRTGAGHDPRAGARRARLPDRPRLYLRARRRRARPASPRRSTFCEKELDVTMALTGVSRRDIGRISTARVDGRRRRSRKTASASAWRRADRPDRATRFAHFGDITTRWMDNDVYGHVNNVVYYSFFDTVVTRYLIEQGELDIANGAVIGLVVETHCSYFKPIAFPDTVRAGLRVAHIGTSSVRYEIGIFRNDETQRGGAGAFRACLCGSREQQAGGAAGEVEGGGGENSAEVAVVPAKAGTNGAKNSAHSRASGNRVLWQNTGSPLAGRAGITASPARARRVSGSPR